MANPNYNLIRYQADNIPQFDGNTKLITRFINACDNFLNNHRNREEPNAPINVCLFDTILSKLTGRAADQIASRIELNTWDLVKNAIIDTFSDRRSIDCLVQDIITFKIGKNETVQQFGLRLQDARSLLFAKINMENVDRNIKILRIQEYNNLILKAYINNLPYNMQLVVRLKNPRSLEQAMSFAQEEENFIEYKNRGNLITKINQNAPQNYNTSQNQSQRNPNVPHVNKPNNNPYKFLGFGQFQYNPQRNFQRPQNYQNIPNRSNYPLYPPRQNINNVSQRPNNNNFSPQQYRGIKRPATSSIVRQNRPQPMDTTSGRNAILHRNQPQRQFLAEELYNQMIEQENNPEFNIENDTEPIDFDPNEYYDDYYPEIQQQENEMCNEQSDENFPLIQELTETS